MPSLTETTVRFPRETAEWALAQVTHATHQAGCEVWEAGSYLRGRELVKDLDVVVVVPAGGDMQAAAGHISAALFGGTGGGRVVRGNTQDTGIQIDLYFCTPDEAGAMKMFLTGPARFNIRCRQRAIKRGYTLNQYGLFDQDETPVCDARDERAIFEALGMDYLTPEQREAFA